MYDVSRYLTFSMLIAARDNTSEPKRFLDVAVEGVPLLNSAGVDAARRWVDHALEPITDLDWMQGSRQLETEHLSCVGLLESVALLQVSNTQLLAAPSALTAVSGRTDRATDSLIRSYDELTEPQKRVMRIAFMRGTRRFSNKKWFGAWARPEGGEPNEWCADSRTMLKATKECARFGFLHLERGDVGRHKDAVRAVTLIRLPSHMPVGIPPGPGSEALKA
ncbi:MAG: hypothetical protein KDB80_03695 [Planctomycetes bacterium]|nr:hypothetical protein [Planctomycetota bacterium]